jgi:hypothetical protein
MSLRMSFFRTLGFGLILMPLVPLASFAGEGPSPAWATQTVAQLETGVEHKHPAVYTVIVKDLFERGHKDEAVFWFYLGQLRYRAYLAAHPNLASDNDPELFQAFMSETGPPLNEYAFGNIPALAATLTRVIAWDEAHPDDYAPKANKARADVVAGLKSLRANILEQKDSIRAQRAARGLPNHR